MSPRKKNPFKDPTVIIAIIGLVGTIITAIVAPIVVERINKSNAPPEVDPTSDTPPISTKVSDQPVNTEEYALQILANAKNWPLVVIDSFDGNEMGWREEDDAEDTLPTVRKIESGNYFWKIYGVTTWARPSKIEPVQNFYASVNALKVNNLTDTRFGINFRDQGTRLFYDFMISMDGHFGVRRYDDNAATPEENVYFVYQPSKNINSTKTNNLSVVGIGDDYWFYINEHFVYYMNDAFLSSGTVGLIAGVKNDEQIGEVAFDNFEIRSAP